MNAVRRLVSAVFATFLSFGKFVILGGSEGEVKSLSDTKSHLPAIILYRQVLARDPFHREAISKLTVLLEAIGENDEAARYRNRLARLESSGQHSTDSKR